MTREKLIHELKQDFIKFCQDIGCSKQNKDCPGNPFCEIVRKAFPFLRKAPYELLKDIMED